MPSEPFDAGMLRKALLQGRPISEQSLEEQMPSECLLTEHLCQQMQIYRSFYQLEKFSRQGCSSQGYQLGCVRAGDYEVVYQCWQPEMAGQTRGHIQTKGTFYLIHGYYDHLGLYGHLIQALLAQGYAVVGLDLPGHGLSSGPRASIISFQDYTQALWQVIQATYQTTPQPYYLIGQSTGGAVAIDWWLNSTLPQEFDIEATVLLAPLVKPANWQQGLLSYYLLSPFIKRIRRGYSRNSHNESFLAFIQDDPLQPRYLAVDWVRALKNWIPCVEMSDPLSSRVLILQGEEDKTVDWRFNTQLLQQKFPQAEICFFPKARHHLVNESEDIRQCWLNRLWQFLQD